MDAQALHRALPKPWTDAGGGEDYAAVRLTFCGAIDTMRALIGYPASCVVS